MRIIIHIGSPKTGTTALQKALAAQRTALLAQGVLYPEIAGRPHHHELSLALLPQQPARGLFQRYHGKSESIVAAGQRALEDMFAAIQNHAGSVIVISSEFLFAIQNNETLSALSERFRLLKADVQCVAYLRDPVSFYLSTCAQALRASHILPAVKSPKYVDILDIWGRHFPIHCNEYSREKLIGGDILTDFSQKYLYGARIEKAEDRNPSLSAEALEISCSFRKTYFPKLVNRNQIEADRLHRALLRADSRVGGNVRLVARPNVKQRIIADFQAQRATLHERYGIEFGGMAYNDSIPENALTMETTAKNSIPSMPHDVYEVNEERLERLRNATIRELTFALCKAEYKIKESYEG